MTRNLLLSGGPTHDFDVTSALLVELFAEAGVPTVVVDEPAEAVLVLREGAAGGRAVSTFTVNALRWRMDEPRYADLRDRFAVSVTADQLATVDAFVREGGGMLAMHTAVICFDAAPRWRDLCGAAWDWGTSSHPEEGPVTVQVTDAGRDHPLTSGLEEFVVHDELYGFLDVAVDVEPLLVGTAGGSTQPVLWARELGRGRVVTDLLGHGPASLGHPEHRRLLGRAAAWLAGGGS